MWSALGRGCQVLEAFVSKRRDCKAALNFLMKLMKGYGRPEQIVTDPQPLHHGTQSLLQSQFQAEARRRSRRVAPTRHGLKDRMPVRAETGSTLSDSAVRHLQRYWSLGGKTDRDAVPVGTSRIGPTAFMKEHSGEEQSSGSKRINIPNENNTNPKRGLLPG